MKNTYESSVQRLQSTLSARKAFTLGVALSVLALIVLPMFAYAQGSHKHASSRHRLRSRAVTVTTPVTTVPAATTSVTTVSTTSTLIALTSSNPIQLTPAKATTTAPVPASSASSAPAPAATTTTTPAPASAPTPAPASSSQECMNYGHQPTTNGQYDWSQVDTNLATMKTAGINCLRLAYNGFNNPNTDALALRAKAQGFYVILGGDWGVLDSSQLSTYDSNAISQAKWNQQNGIPQMGLGNEQETRLSGITQAQWAQHMVQLAAQIHQVYSGKVSYEINSDYLPLWQQNGIGALDLLGLNVYCGAGCNADRIQSAITSFGVNHVYVSETNSDMDTGRFDSDAAHAADVQQNYMALLKKFPIPMYYFAFISGGTAPAHWGLYNGTTLVQPLTAAALGIK